MSENAPTWSILLYGIPGVGKSTLAAQAPAPYFLDLENGLKRVKCSKSPRISTYEEVLGELRGFIKSDYKTVVIDTVDKLDELLAVRALAAYNHDNKPARSIGEAPYGRGAEFMVSEWRAFGDVMDKIGDAGKNVLLIGHEQIVKFSNPSDADFEFYTVNLHKKSAPVLIAKCDAVFFAHFETVIKDKTTFKDKAAKGKASTTGERVIQTCQGASWVGKNRFGLDEVEPMNAELFTKIQ